MDYKATLKSGFRYQKVKIGNVNDRARTDNLTVEASI